MPFDENAHLQSTPRRGVMERDSRIILRKRRIWRSNAKELWEEVLNPTASAASLLSLERYQSVLTQLLEFRQQIREADAEILRLLQDDAEIDADIDEAEEFDRRIGSSIASLKTAITGDPPVRLGTSNTVLGHESIASAADNPQSPSVSQASNVQDSSQHITTASASAAVARPETTVQVQPAAIPFYRPVRESELAPPVFDGERLKYRAFITRFNSYVDRLHGITLLERLIVLQKYLRGEPLELVSALELVDANYEVAIRVLEDNYAVVSDEKFRLLRELQVLPRVPKPYDLLALKKMIALVQANVAALAANGVPLSQYAISLFTAISQAIPQRLRDDFESARELDQRLANPADEFTFPSAAADVTEETSRLIGFIRKRVRQVEAGKNHDSAPSTAGKDLSAHQTQSSTSSKHQQRRLLSTVAAAVPKGKANQFRPKPCLFCNVKEHNSSRCPADLTIARRRELLRSLKRCERCFRNVHAQPSECRGPRSVCDKCRSSDHYTAMHPEESVTSVPIVAAASGESCSSVANTLLFTLSAYVTNHGLKIPVRIFVDPGSSLSFVTPSLLAMLRESPVGLHDLNIQGYANRQVRKATPSFNIRISGPRGECGIEVIAHRSEFGVDPPNISPKAVVDALREFNRKFPLADRSYLGEWTASPPALLLGMDQWNKLRVKETPKTVIGDVTAYPSKFGWLIGGVTDGALETQKGDVTAAVAVCCAATVAATLDRMSQPARDLQRLWNLDIIGIVDPPEKSTQLSTDDESAVQQFHASLSYDNNRYVTRFPKRPTIDQLPNNRSLAVQRLERTVQTLKRDPARYSRYNDEILSFVRQNFAVEIAPEDQHRERSYHMPHHAVENSSGKSRIVFDCSAKDRDGSSLNSHLLRGPNQNPELVTLLLKFRTGRIAVSADIAKAYMMIAVHEDDQPYFRFVWRGPEDNQVRTFQLTRVAWGAASSGFILAATIREHFRRVGPPADQLGSRLYADDFLYSCNSEAEAKTFTDVARSTLAGAGMDLAKWKSNSKAVLEHLQSSGVDQVSFDTQNCGLFKVLGISWDTQTDRFHFAIPDLQAQVSLNGTVTKRCALSTVAAVYDPLGWLLPLTVRGKLIIQRLWAVDLKWSDPIPEDIHQDLNAWVDELQVLRQHSIPRRFSERDSSAISYHLHLFGDSSQKAYAAAGYVEHRYADGKSEIALAMCKSRVAPRDPITLPRLELLASLIAVRLRKFLTDRLGLEFSSVRHYTDSKIAYHWATSARPGSWRPFVSNRVHEIQADSKPSEWFHVRGSANVSDLATRGISAEALVKSDDWWFGPSWLRLPEAEQPISQPMAESSSLEQVSDEARRIVSPAVVVQPLMDLDRHGTAGRAVRTMSYVFEFIHRLRREPLPAPAELYRRAESHIVRESQRQFFKHEIASVRAGERVCSSSKLAAFQLFVDESDILRARTRLTLGAALTFDEKNPMIIPGESRLARLLIIDAHRINAHFGANTILSHLRRKFWITRARQIVKTVLHRCVTCRRRQGKHAEQVEGQLPDFRAELRAPFSSSGLDYCGPFLTRHRDVPQKTFVALFTCSATRAVHLEAVPSLSSPQTVLALRRFLAAYPACTQLVSDNARSFTKASSELKKLFNTSNDPEVQEILRGRAITWRFICERAPNHGGFYERLVGVLKSCLYKTLGRSLVGYEEFRTILGELASVINNRPITYVSAEADSPDPLTPAHFLRGGPNVAPVAQIAPVDQLRSDEIATPQQLRRGLAARTNYFRSLCSRWSREYLLLLRSAALTKGTATVALPIGEVCLLREDNRPRSKWELVRIVDQHMGRDGHVRVYSIKFSNGFISRRAAQHLYPLEVSVAN